MNLRKVLIRGFWITVLLTVLTVLWSLWFVSHHGFTKSWRRLVCDEAAKRGIFMDVKRLTLSPTRGLTARDVRIYDSRAKNARVLATINAVVLDINYSNLAHKAPFLNAVDLRNATVTLPLGDTPADRLRISRLNARIQFPPHRLHVERAEGIVQGLRVSVSGHFSNPEQFQWRTKEAYGAETSPPLTTPRSPSRPGTWR